MAAPSIAALLDYETNIEDALATYLAAQIASTQVLTTRTLIATEEILETPRVTVSVNVTGTNPNQQATRTTDSAEYDAHKMGTVSLVAVIRRNASGQSMTTLRGGLRKAMLAATAALTAVNLPYYQIVTLREAASSAGINADNDEVYYTLNYNLEFFIKPDQWAAS
jgi:adenosylcobinamide amidohydrolase